MNYDFFMEGINHSTLLLTLTLKFSFASASWHQEQTMNKCTLSIGIPAKTSLQNALSEGNHNGRGHGTAQDEGANIKTGINQSCSFSTVPQSSFGTRGRQHQGQLKVVIIPFISGSPFTFGQACCCSCLIQILRRWAASFSQNLSSPPGESGDIFPPSPGYFLPAGAGAGPSASPRACEAPGMAVGGVGSSLLLMSGVVVTVGLCRRLARRRLRSRPLLFAFLVEMFSTFQICACTNELSLLGSVEPKPHTALTLTYGFTVLHGLTLAGSACNPCGTLQPMWGGGTSPRMGGLKIAAQFVAAVLARVFMHFIWSLEMAEPHLGALSQGCTSPMQTTEMQAFCIELLFSVVFQLAVLRAESVSPKYRVHLIALLITMLVYAGGNLTGAIFNPALAFSLHADCFYDKFLSYSLVYWIAPCLGTILVAFIWDELFPQIS